MKPTDNQTTVVRTGRGLSVSGTRISLYQIMDYLKAEWHPSDKDPVWMKIQSGKAKLAMR
ncbi:MAG: hypothetical protein BWK80_27095 [Desulfobacteraceae bacterium IS3]|nr:MAG: hypothetical protein BWK80_27095 [Desulfobacteraceae bacterium IS3]HAO19662.1 hypothetical protein [Desulfobacteraceae bacterium]